MSIRIIYKYILLGQVRINPPQKNIGSKYAIRIQREGRNTSL